MNTVSHGMSIPRTNYTPIGVRFAIFGASAFFLIPLRAYYVARNAQIDGAIASGRLIERIHMPAWFWVSTLTLLVSSLSLWGAKRFALNSDPRLARRALWASATLGYAFLILQIPGFLAVLEQHRLMSEQRVFVYGSMALLFALHAAHVIGGLVPLTAVTLRSRERPIDVERVPTLRFLGWYWHFLALVWFVIFNVILLVG